MYAIIATGGKQYKVSEGDIIKVEKLDAEAGATVTFDQVVAVSDKELKVAGDVANASVTATVMEQGRYRKENPPDSSTVPHPTVRHGNGWPCSLPGSDGHRSPRHSCGWHSR